MTTRPILLIGVLMLAGCAGRPSTSSTSSVISPEDARALALAHREGAGAYFGRDLDGATKAFTRALELNPGADSIVYTLASVAAEGGRKDEAYGWLEKLAAANSDLVPVARDFPGLEGERFEQLIQRISQNAPSKHADVAFTLPERDLIPEGIAHDPVKGTFFVGSIRKRKIVAIRRDGSTSDFVPSRAHEMLSPLGMKVDAQRRHLWVASFAAGTMEGFTKEDEGRATLFRFDVDSGELLAQFPRQTPGKHLLNDVAIAADGTVYVTDSEAGEVLRLSPDAAEGDAFEVVLPAGELIYPNGIALSQDGRTLYVADFVQGITAVKLDTGDRSIVRHPLGMTTRDIDGMYLHGNSLVAVQNGTGPGRVVRFVLSPDGDQIVRSEVLEANHPSFILPTTGTIVEDAIYVVANAQLRSFDAEGNIWPLEKLHPIDIIRVPLR